ncbi:MAG TPA: hypothetical protein VJ810_12745 [Blastocatellia bacterium]|nr:hypothetical protein [Blastocatellia bacterium]
MNVVECMCEKIDRLEGSAVPIYLTLYLDESGADEPASKIYYVCKFCGRPWTQEMIEEKPVLTRMETEFNV